MSNIWTDLGGALPAGLGGASVLLVQSLAKWIRAKAYAAKMRREVNVPGGPEFGTIGWVWNELTRIITQAREDMTAMIGVLRGDLEKARSKGHAVEAWCSQNAQRLAAIEQHLFGESRMQSGEQERIDWINEQRPPMSRRLPSPALGDAATEPDPLPPMRDSRPSISTRRSRP